MKLKKLAAVSAAALLGLAITSHSVLAKNNGHGGGGGNGGGGGGGGGGSTTALFTIESEGSTPFVPLTVDHSVDSHGQMVFYVDNLDFTQFVGQRNDGSSCNPGVVNGTLVVKPRSNTDLVDADLISYFPYTLDSGDPVTYKFTMQGTFEDPSNWPPSASNPFTTVTFDYWEYSAENKKDQRQDCAGSLPLGSSETWTMDVTRLP
jgi:hypothetical protein